MSDAVNLLVYVGLPDDCDAQENIKLVLQQVIKILFYVNGGIFLFCSEIYFDPKIYVPPSDGI
jgi:hypothetical protein